MINTKDPAFTWEADVAELISKAALFERRKRGPATGFSQRERERERERERGRERDRCCAYTDSNNIMRYKISCRFKKDF